MDQNSGLRGVPGVFDAFFIWRARASSSQWRYQNQRHALSLINVLIALAPAHALVDLWPVGRQTLLKYQPLLLSAGAYCVRAGSEVSGMHAGFSGLRKALVSVNRRWNVNNLCSR
jgi:hypothetical protein